MKKLGCLFIVLIILLVIAGAGYFGYQKVDEAVGWKTVKEAYKGADNTFTSLRKGELRLAVPDELWQSEVRQVFPVEQDVGGFAKVVLGNPVFVADTDPTWLRVTIDLDVKLSEDGVQTLPGKAIVRTQLRYDKETLRILLSNAELVQFAIGGVGAETGEGLKPLVADVLAAELHDFEVLKIPTDGEVDFLKSGAGFLRDVTIDNGQVVVVLGK